VSFQAPSGYMNGSIQSAQGFNWGKGVSALNNPPPPSPSVAHQGCSGGQWITPPPLSVAHGGFWMILYSALSAVMPPLVTTQKRATAAEGDR
jgi:hypothetical protein